MNRKIVVRSVLVLGLAVISLMVLLWLLDGAGRQVYAASSQPAGRVPSTHPVPPLRPAVNPPAAPLFNGSGTSVITVCNSCPYTDVQAAVTAIPSGGIVKVAQGTYTDTDGSDGVVHITKTLTLRGGYTTTNWNISDPVAYPTVLDGENTHRVILVADNVSPTIEGFHIINGSPSSGCGGGVYIGGGATLQRNRIYGNASSSIGGGICVFGGSPTLVNNLIYTNTASNNGGGVYIAGGTPLLHHNTLYDNLTNDSGGGVYIAGGTPVISATIIVSNTASDGGGIYGAGGVMGYNDVWGNSGGQYGGGATADSGSISDKPRFVNPPGLDLRLQANSPCRDKVPFGQMAEMDYWGLARPFGAQADIGAHEFYTGTCFARIGAGQVYSNVQAAVDVSSAGDLVQVAGICRGVEGRTVGSIVLTQTVFISQALTLRGGYTITNWADSDPGAYPTTLDAQGEGRVIYIANGAGSPTVENLRIVGGDAGGILAENDKGNNGGGGIYNYGGSPTIRNNIVYNNQGNQGGGIYNYDGSPTIQNNTIYSNSVSQAVTYKEGGGIYIEQGSNASILGNWIYSNTGEGGGGIYLSKAITFSIQSNHIRSNTASGNTAKGGGGICVSMYSSGAIEGNWIYTNTAECYGGGMYVNSSDTVIEDNWIYDNLVYSTDDPWQRGGGGICVTADTTVQNNAIYNNSAFKSSGGGIHVRGNAKTAIKQNTIHDNDAAQGGGIYVRGGSAQPTIENNFIYSNTSGILFSYASLGAMVDSNNIYLNGHNVTSTYDYTDGVYADLNSGKITIRNSIIVSNAGYGVRGEGSNAIITVTYSAVWGNTSGNYGGGAVAGTGVITANPQFVNPTSADFHLQPGSPCIDTADPDNYPPNDYANYARPFGSRADMGAYEFYTGTCFAQIEGATHIYTTVQAALDAVTQTTTVKVAGVCEGAQPRAVGSATFTQTAYVSQSLTLRGGYTVSVGLEDGTWTTPTYRTILDAQGQGRAIYITGTGVITVDGFILRGGSAITGGGLYIAAPLSPTVQNVIFYSNTAQYGGGLASAGGDPRLYNDTFVTNTATVTGGGLYVVGDAPVISNTIVVSNAGGGIWAGSGASLAYNDVWGNTGDDYAGGVSAGVTDFAADPLFADLAGGDFHLGLQSPCVHTADPETGLEWDLEGDVRPLGRGADVGADEAALYADVAFAPYSWLGGIPGRTAAHAHVLTNTGSISDTFDLTHTLVASGTGWGVDYTPVFTLTAGEAAAAPVVVTVPDDAVSGTVATVILTATSRANSAIYAVVSNTTMANWNPGVELAPPYTEHVNPGTVLTYVHTLTNTGNAPDTFAIDFSSVYDWATGWAVVVTPTTVTDLAAQGTITVWVRVEVPDTAPGGLIETTVISAASPSSGARTIVTDTTQVNYTTGDRYVRTNGNDTLNNCLVSGSPCRTIVHAVDQAFGGDTIKLAAGTYNEHDISINKDVTLQGGYATNWLFNPSIYQAVVDAQGMGRVFYVFGSPTIEWLTIKGGNTAGSGGGVYVDILSSPIIRGNVITGNVASVYGGGIHSEGSPIVEQNDLAYNQATRGGAFSSAAGNSGFWNNMVYGNQASLDGGGVYVSGGSPRIWHDTIYDNDAGTGGGIYLAGGSSVVSNTIVAKNTATITGSGVYSAASGAHFAYNDVWHNDYVGLSAVYTSTDPMFRNAPWNLRLLESSPLIDQGDTTPLTEDFEGGPRDKNPDIGADEYRRFGVEISPGTGQMGDPGANLSYSHVVTNTGNYTDTIVITGTRLSGGDITGITVDPEQVDIGAGLTATVDVQVTIDKHAVNGSVDTVRVTAVSYVSPSVYDTTVDTVTIGAVCDDPAWLGRPNTIQRFSSDPSGPKDVTFYRTLENNANLTQTFDIAWNEQLSWLQSMAPDPVTLNPTGTVGAQARVYFTVTIPQGPTGTLMVNQTYVTATSGSPCNDSASTGNHIVVNQHPGLEMSPDGNSTDNPGEEVTYEHVLKNTGNYYDNIWLTWRTEPGWEVTVDGYSDPNEGFEVGLASGATTTITVQVKIPLTATCYMSNTTIVTATSWAGYYDPYYEVKRVSVTDVTGANEAPGVELEPDRTGHVSSAVGQYVSIMYTHTLTNTGNCLATFDLYSQSSSGFTATVSPADQVADLPSGESREIAVTVTVPATDSLAVGTTIITATHDSLYYLPNGADIVEDTTIVNQAAGVVLAPDNTSLVTQTASGPITVLYTHTLTNSGNYTDTFEVAGASSHGWPVTPDPGQPDLVVVPSNGTRTITVEMTLQPTVYTTTDSLVVTATSQFSPTVLATAVDTTTVRRPHVTLYPDFNTNVYPGDIVVHSHILSNTGGLTSTCFITYFSSMGWAVVTPTVVYALPPGDWSPVTATVSVPTGTNVLSGTGDVLVITATSQITEAVYDTVRDATTVPYRPQASLTPEGHGSGQAGVAVPYTHTLTNLGNYTESFHLQTWSGFANAFVSPQWVTLGPGESYTSVVVTVILPTHAAAGETEDTQINASFVLGDVFPVVLHDYTLVNSVSGLRYVSPDGTDDNNSCLEYYNYGPCATVQQAVKQAISGDAVHVAQGVYTDVQVTGGYTQAVYLDKNVTLLGGYVNGDWSADPDPVNNQTVLDAGGQGRVIYVAAGVTSTIEGFHLRHGFVEGNGAGVYIASGATPAVRWNLIYSNTAAESGGGVYYKYTAGDSNLVVERNIVYSNTAGAKGGGCYVYGSYGSGVEQHVWNNVLYRNTATDGGGLYLAGNSVTVWNNTFYSNTATNGGGAYLFSGSSAISNTIFASNANYGIYKEDGQSGTPVLNYNLVWENSPGNFHNVNPGSNTITTTPGFVDAAGGDFHLRTDSNAIDAGAGTTGSLPPNDLDGNQRPLPIGGQYDIGAYENGLRSVKATVPYAPAGGTLTYTISITNSGDAPRDITVVDRLHDYLDYAGLSATPTGSSSYSNHTVQWQGTLPSSTTALITITTTITDWLAAGTPITNVAQVNYVPGSIVTTTITGTHGARYVALTGNDAGSNCMRPDLPCRTIQYAITQALASDEVRVASGVYTGTGQVAYINKALALTGGYTPTMPAWSYDPESYTTTLDAQGSTGVVITNSAAASVGGFHIVSGTSGVAVHAATTTISRCRIYDNGDGISATVGILTLARSWVYENSNDGVDVSGGTYSLINAVVAHNGAAGVRATGVSTGSLLHDTFARNATAGVIVSGTARFTNTLFYSHSVGVNVIAGTAYLSNTLWYSNTANQGTIISSTNWFDLDPRFENPDGMDYHVQAGSSVVDRGLDTWLSEDIDGEQRPLLQKPDLGADEFSLVILKRAPHTADPGQVITYSIMLQGGETGLVLTDTLDAYLAYTGTVVCDVGTCGYLSAQQAITWTGDAPADYPVYVTYTTQITSWLAAGEQILNYAQVLISGDLHNTNQVATTINALPGTRYVATTGVDTDNNCLMQWKPCATVQHAVDQALAGDAVKVAGGDYTGSGPVVNIGKSITLTGGYTTTDWLTSDPEAHPTRLDGQGSGRVVSVGGGASVTIDGFHLLNGSVTGSGGGLSVNGGATVTLVNSRVYSNTASASGGGVYAGSGVFLLSQSQVYSNTAANGGGIYAANAALTLSDNRIYTNTATSSGGGVRAYSATGLTMERNVLLDNRADLGGGVAVTNTLHITMTNNIVGSNRAGTGGGGLSFGGSGSGLLRHNTIAGNGSEGLRVGDFTLALTNTILSGHTVAITTTTGADVTADHTLWDGSGTYTDTSGGGSITTLGDVTGSPAYRDQAGMDYHITGSSAALGAGTYAGVSTDIDGEDRASPPDIGADQYSLRVDRWASAVEVAPCQTVIHTLVLTNVADSLVSGVVLTDALPISVTYSSGSITYTAGSGGYLAGSRTITWSGDLAAQSSVYITYTVAANPYLAAGTVITFTASISDPVSVFPGNPLTVTVHTIPATAAKQGVGAVSPAGQATIGELVTYTVVYTVPAGHQTTDPLVVDELPRLIVGSTVSTTPALTYTPGSLVISGATTKTETISPDGGTITWTLDSVTATCGAPTVATLTFNARLLDLSDNTAGDPLTDTLDISYDDGVSNRVITDEQTLSLVEPGLTLTHTAALTQNLGMGDLVVITVTVANPGNSALYDVALTDTLGSGWTAAGSGSAVFTHTLTSIGAGSQVPVTFTARVNDDVGPAVTVTATAEAVGSSLPGLEPQERNYADTEPLTATTGLLDLTISKDGPAVRSPNQSILYTIAYTNTGVVRAQGVQISDTLPFSLTGVISTTSAGATVERAGQTVTWTLTAPLSRSVGGQIWITATVSGAATEGTVLTNTVAITTTGVESDTVNNGDLTTTTIRLPVLSITKTLNPLEPLTARLLTYTLTISNTGLGDATDLFISDTVPASTTYQSCSGDGDCGFDGNVVTWTLPLLPTGEDAQVYFTALVNSDAYSGTAIINQAYSVSCAQGVEDTGVPVTATVPLRQELYLEPASAQQSVLPGAQVVYTHTLINQGTLTATVSLTVSNAPSGWQYTLEPTLITSLEIGAGAGRLVTLTVRSPITTGQAAAVITATWQGASGVYATAVDTTTVNLVRGLSLTPPTQDKSVMPGEQAVYTHTLTNQGNVTATFDLTVSVAPSGWTYTLSPSGAGAVADLAPNGSALVTLTVQAPAGAGPATAVITATWQGASGVYATAVDTTTIGCVSVSGVSIGYSPTAPRIGQTVTFTGTASGTAPLSYAWSFDDGSNDENGQSVTHVYNDAGSYNVQLTVTNCGTSQASAQRTVIVNPYNIYLPLVLRNF